MNARHRWWLAGALLCVSAAAAHRARANEAPIVAAAASMPFARAVLGPLRLIRPLEPETIERAVQEADSLYLGLKASEANAAFAAVVELDPLNAFAWLRLGNLHQRAGRDGEALDAYARASAVPPVSAAAAEARGKALLNIALLSVARAGRAMDELDAMNALALEAAREEAARQVAEQRLRADRATASQSDTAARWPAPGVVRVVDTAPPLVVRPSEAAPVPVPVARSVPVPVGAPAARTARPAMPAAVPAVAEMPSDAFEPYTVDRWIAKPRRPAARPVKARSAVTEPLTPSPLMPPPVIESFTGGFRR
jgi:hypothetical protein